MTSPIIVVGASGFVGGHVVEALSRRGAEVRRVQAPRVQIAMSAEQRQAHLQRLRATINGYPVVVNAAGVSDATGVSKVLTEANQLMPALVADVTRATGARLIHISSAAVQGRKAVLDSTLAWRPFSPYSASKAEGERALLGAGDHVCIYRPPGVHGTDRSVTRTLVRLACSSFSSVASPGELNTPQALAENVGDAVAFLATSRRTLPSIVHHPSEGLTTASLLTALGGRPPRMIPAPVALATVRAMYVAAHARAGLEGQARRLEVLWFGQEQAPSWLSEAGWQAPVTHEGWRSLGLRIRNDLRSTGRTARDGNKA